MHAVKISVLWCLVAWSSTLAPNVAAECPKLEPVGVDEAWFYQAQGKEGWYAPIGKGSDGKSKPLNPKPMAEIKGSKTSCWKTHIVIGKQAIDAPAVKCSFNSISQQYCVIDESGKVSAQAAATAARAPLPKASLNTIVATDNETYIAMGTCVDGDIYGWAILSTEAKMVKVKASMLKALHITPEELKVSQAAKFKAGRTLIVKGDCPKGGKAGVGQATKLASALGGGGLSKFPGVPDSVLSGGGGGGGDSGLPGGLGGLG